MDPAALTWFHPFGIDGSQKDGNAPATIFKDIRKVRQDAAFVHRWQQRLVPLLHEMETAARASLRQPTDEAAVEAMVDAKISIKLDLSLLPLAEPTGPVTSSTRVDDCVVLLAASSERIPSVLDSIFPVFPTLSYGENDRHSHAFLQTAAANGIFYVREVYPFLAATFKKLIAGDCIILGATLEGTRPGKPLLRTPPAGRQFN